MLEGLGRTWTGERTEGAMDLDEGLAPSAKGPNEKGWSRGGGGHSYMLVHLLWLWGGEEEIVVGGNG